MEAKLVDASVLAAWAFGEPRASEAREILSGARLYAPRLMGYELAHVAVKKIERHPELQTQILEALGLALRLAIRWVDVDHQEVTRLALQENLTAYDASYLHASRALGIALATFDRLLARRAAER